MNQYKVKSNLELYIFNRILIIFNNFVYDLTNFSSLHPGGSNKIQQFNGHYVDNVNIQLIVFQQIILNPQFHQHTQSSLITLEKYKYGYIDTRKTPPQKSSTLKNTPKSIINFSNDQQKQTIKEKTQQSQQQALKISFNPDAINQSFDFEVNELTSFNKQKTSPNLANKKIEASGAIKSFVSSKSQFLTIPDPMEVLKQQKIKQLKQIQEQMRKENEIKKDAKPQEEIKIQTPIEKKKQKSEILEIIPLKLQSTEKEGKNISAKSNQQRQEYSHNQSTQSDILVIKPKRKNQFYEQWKQNQLNISQSILSQQKVITSNEQLKQNEFNNNQNSLSQKKMNIFYEEWKKKNYSESKGPVQEQIHHNEENKCQEKFTENWQIIYFLILDSYSFDRQQSSFESTNLEEKFQLKIPVLKPKLIRFIRNSFIK